MWTRLILCLLILAVGAPSPSTDVARSSDRKDVPTVAYCDLLRNPDAYNGKQVRITADYRLGFEWSELYCLECWGMEGRTWADFDEVGSCTRNAVRRLTKAYEGTFKLTVVGEFQSSGGRYGHMGAYRYQFVVKCVEEAKRLLKGSPIPTYVPPGLLKDTC